MTEAERIRVVWLTLALGALTGIGAAVADGPKVLVVIGCFIAGCAWEDLAQSRREMARRAAGRHSDFMRRDIERYVAASRREP